MILLMRPSVKITSRRVLHGEQRCCVRALKEKPALFQPQSPACWSEISVEAAASQLHR